MEKIIELSEKSLKEINAGDKEWVLLGCLISPVMAAFSIGFYLEYNS